MTQENWQSTLMKLSVVTGGVLLMNSSFDVEWERSGEDRGSWAGWPVQATYQGLGSVASADDGDAGDSDGDGDGGGDGSWQNRGAVNFSGQNYWIGPGGGTPSVWGREWRECVGGSCGTTQRSRGGDGDGDG